MRIPPPLGKENEVTSRTLCAPLGLVAARRASVKDEVKKKVRVRLSREEERQRKNKQSSADRITNLCHLWDMAQGAIVPRILDKSKLTIYPLHRESFH